MAYTTANLKLVHGGVIQEWVYDSTDTLAVVLGAGYITNAIAVSRAAVGKGMRPGDKVLFRRFTDLADDTTFTGASHLFVSSVNTTTGAATLEEQDRGALGTASAVAGAATLAAVRGKITTEALTTAQNAIYTLTLTNSMIAAADLVFASVADGTNTQGTPIIGQVNPGAGSVVIEVINQHASAEALNGTLEISFFVSKV
jgi:hypothetical protein